MAYSTLEEIQSEFKATTFSESTIVKASDVDLYILQADALINSYVGKLYSLPISTSAEGYQLLKMISMGVVSDRVRAKLEVKQSTNAGANQQPRRPLDTSNMISILKDIAKGAMPLVGVSQITSGSGLYSENVYNEVVPEFNKSTTQW